MSQVVVVYDLVLGFLRPALFYGAVFLAAVCGMDYAVRTRKINPFGAVARFFRASVDPLIAPVERRVVQSGGLPNHAPWYALAAVVVGGIIIISVLGFVRGQLEFATDAIAFGGARGLVRIVVTWTFGFLQLALIATVVASWVRGNPYSRWWRWAFVVTDPMLRPLRRVIPALGMIDVTPIVAYFGLRLLQGAVLGIL